MLSLDDPRWSELSHAYGSAADIPALLKQAADDPSPKLDYRTPPWFDLWSALCHQGDAYSASFAALPHLIAIAETAPPPIAFDVFLLPAAIDVARVGGRAPEVPSFLHAAYFDAIARLPHCFCVQLRSNWTREMQLSASAALAVALKDYALAEALINLDDYWIGKINLGEYPD